jgi:hypothetical protein
MQPLASTVLALLLVTLSFVRQKMGQAIATAPLRDPPIGTDTDSKQRGSLRGASQGHDVGRGTASPQIRDPDRIGPEISCSCRHTIRQPSGHTGRSPTRKPPIGMGRTHRCVGLGAIASKRKSARCTAGGLNEHHAKMCACIALVPGRRNWDGTDDGRLDHSAGSRQRHV